MALVLAVSMAPVGHSNMRLYMILVTTFFSFDKGKQKTWSIWTVDELELSVNGLFQGGIAGITSYRLISVIFAPF